MASIHEDDIKRIALGFLRTYYKHRPRSGDMTTATNMRGEGGIIVDSYLAYQDEVGDQFIATAEATSVDTREEVQFTVQHRLLLWDSVVFGVLFGFVFVLISYFVPFLSMPAVPPNWRGMMIALVSIGLILFYYYRIRPLRRYRYIYAIAQFKKYHADEQWVAMAKAVFPKMDKDRNYRELKRQCTRFGFGLILVDNQKQPRMVLSPSREEQFERRRERVPLIDLQKYIRIKELARSDWQLMRWWQRWTDPYREHDYLRFESGFKNQAALIALGLALIAIAFFQEYQRMPVFYPNESTYTRKLEQRVKNLNGEEDAKDPQPFIVPFGDTSRSALIPDPEAQKEEIAILPVEPKSEVLIFDPYNQTIITYDCERMYNFTGTKYIIEIGQYGDQAQARDDLEILGDAGLNCVVFWEGCFSPTREAFIMYIGTMYNEMEEAQLARDSLNRKLTAIGLPGRIRPVSPLIDR